MSDPVRATTPVLQLKSPTDVLEAVPYLLGFHPQNSLVVLSLRRPRLRLGLTMRLDRNHLEGSRAAAQASWIAQLVARERAEAALLVGYADADGPEQARPLHDAISVALGRKNIVLRESLHVMDGRWWSLQCNEPGCCPPDGRPLPEPGERPDIAYAGVVNGVAPLPSRQALVESLAPAGTVVRAALAQAMERELAQRQRRLGEEPTSRSSPRVSREYGERLAQERLQTLALAKVAVADALEGPIRLPVERMAELLAGLTDRTARDLCLEWSAGDQADAAQRLWTHLARHASPPVDAVPLTLLAWSAYRGGNGALAWVALDRARASDPTYAMAQLLEQGLERCVPPNTLAEVEAGIRPLRAGQPAYVPGRARKRR